MTLREKQSLHVRLVAKLILKAEELGYELTWGETYRTKEQAEYNERRGIGTANSLHTVRLAVDFNLFKDGEWLKTTEAFQPLGDYWESLHPFCRWGGRFASGDGNHFSLEHEGRK